MSDEAFSAAILSNPDDDTPRLVYADYLDEHGDSDRAEFIRLQCRLATMNDWDDGFTAASVRCRRLLAAHPEWLEPFRRFTLSREGSDYSGPPFARGFPEHVEQYFDTFLERHAEFFAQFPVRSARLVGGPAVWGATAHTCDELATCPGLARLRKLDANVDPAALGRFAAVPHLRGLESLTVRTGVVDPAVLRTLVESEHLRGLRSFRLFNSGMGGQLSAAASASRWDWFPKLTHLELNGTYFDGFIEELFLRAEWVPRLRRLRSGGSGSSAVWAALREGRVSGLMELEAGNLAAMEDKIVALSRPDAPRLRKLRFGPPPQTNWAEAEEFGARFFAAPALADLRSLDASGGRLTFEWSKALAASPLPRTLRGLSAYRSGLPLGGLRAWLGVRGGWPHLERLDVSNNILSDNVVDELVDAKSFPKLVRLAVGHREPSPVFLTRLAESPDSARFRELDLHVKMDDATAGALFRSPHLENLDVLRVVKGTAGRTPCDRLKRRFGSRVTILPNRQT